MKTLVTLLGLITASLLSGEAATTVKIRAYSAIGELNFSSVAIERRDHFTLGARILLTCDVTGLSERNEVVSYKWFRNCTGHTQYCEIQEGDPYYRVVKDTLLVDVTSFDQGGKYYCGVFYLQEIASKRPGFTPQITVAGNPAPFLYTPTSLLPEHSVLTDVQQATGRNGQQWITCKSGREGTRPEIWMGSELVVNSSTAISVTIGLRTQHPNGLYHCSSAQSQREYFSLFVNISDNLPTPTVSGWDTSMWTLTSPDGNQVERYIVEFQCRVRSITFVEKYMSVSASGGTGQVAASVSCFGGLGQLYRVKVWAVSGPNISRQPAVKFLTPEGSTGTPSDVPSSTRSSTASDAPTSSPKHVDNKPEGDFPTNVSTGSGPFIEAGVGVGLCLLLVVLALVASVVVVAVVVKRRAANKRTGSIKMGGNPCYNNPVVVELEEKDVGAEYDDTVKSKENGSITDGFDPYEDVDTKAQNRTAKTPPLKASCTPASATNVEDLYAVVDKSKKKGTKKKEEENGCMETDKDDLYTVPVKKYKMTDNGRGANGGAERSEDNDDVAELKYEPKADGEPGQQSEGEEKSSNADMLYAVVDKSRKKKQ